MSHVSAVSEAGEMPAAESDHAQRVLSSLNQQRAVGRFCDAVLNVGGGVVYLAHRNILACFSELFQQSNMPAAPCMEFCLQECPNDGLELLLNFVYTGELKLNPENLEKVQHAASSLCVPEALALCERFKETSVAAAPLKRKRGRPRKSKSDTIPSCSVTDQTLLSVKKQESIIDSVTHNFSTAATTTTTATTSATTTTRSGRVVKGPRRLVTDETPDTDVTATEKANKRAPLIPAEKERSEDVVENQNPDQPTEVENMKHMHGKIITVIVQVHFKDEYSGYYSTCVICR